MKDDPRIDAILEVLVAIAKSDFSRRAPVEGTGTIDALAAGVNMLAEELDGAIASRAELEAAHADLRTAQAKLIVAEKMAAIGLLASGVAHEVNNPAAWVSLSLGLLRRSVATLERRVEDDEMDRVEMREQLARMKVLLADAIDGVTRITTVVQDLRTLSRADDKSFEEISFGDVVSGARRLAASALEGAEVLVEIDDSAVIVANRGRVAQVVTNLLVNAAHAVRACDAPSILVSTTAVDGGVVLAVEDNGPGIDAELRGLVFDPFFTTKAPAEGTGLGLTIVAQIASSSGGWARVVEPKTLAGARVEVFFPGVATEHAAAAT